MSVEVLRRRGEVGQAGKRGGRGVRGRSQTSGSVNVATWQWLKLVKQLTKDEL